MAQTRDIESFRRELNAFLHKRGGERALLNPRARSNWAQVVVAAVGVLIPVIERAGQKTINKFLNADRETQIKMARRWSIFSPPLWAVMRNKKVANQVVEYLISKEGREAITASADVAGTVAVATYEAKKNARRGWGYSRPPEEMGFMRSGLRPGAAKEARNRLYQARALGEYAGEQEWLHSKVQGKKQKHQAQRMAYIRKIEDAQNKFGKLLREMDDEIMDSYPYEAADKVMKDARAEMYAVFRQARSAMTKKNPRARRNTHLIVGERVKLSDEGWAYLKGGGHFDLRPWEFEKNSGWHMGYTGPIPDRALHERRLTASTFRRSQTEILGDVVGVTSEPMKPNGYFIVWDGEKKDAWVPDKYVVSASSTSRKWPGNHYKGVDPMAKKNRRKARRNMAVEAHGRRFDTVGELVEYEKAYGLDPRQGGAQHRPAELAVAAAHATPEFQQMEREMREKMRERVRVRGVGTGVRKKSPMMFPQLTDNNWRYKGAYDAVSYYLGGQKQYAPELKAEAKKKRKKLANVGALMHMGLTPDMAFAFLSEMGARYPSTTQEEPKGKPRIVASEITPEIQAEARAVLLPHLSGSTASSNPRGAPPLAPSPFIGYPSQYNMPTNAGPYQTQLYPFGQGGRPATFQYESVKEVLERSPTGPAGGPSIRAARNPRYSIPLQYPEWEFDVWAPQPVVANWTSYPPYSYKQFYRQNPRKSGKTREGYIKYGSGPLGGLTPSERKSIPSHMFLEPRKRSFPVPDRNHAWIAVQYMTRFHIPNAPTLIRRLAKFYPPADRKNGRIWERYHRLREDIEKMSGKKMPTLAQLARSRAVANSILGRR